MNSAGFENDSRLSLLKLLNFMLKRDQLDKRIK